MLVEEGVGRLERLRSSDFPELADFVGKIIEYVGTTRRWYEKHRNLLGSEISRKS